MATADELILVNIVELMDRKAREAGFLPLIAGEVYERQYSKTSHIFIVFNEGQWSAWRETWRSDQRRSFSERLIVDHATFEQAVREASRYLKNVIR